MELKRGAAAVTYALQNSFNRTFMELKQVKPEEADGMDSF